MENLAKKKGGLKPPKKLSFLNWDAEGVGF
jgi:hypothetical protein